MNANNKDTINNNENNNQTACDECKTHISDKQNKLDKCNIEIITTQEKYVRILADFQNFQRRVEKDKEQWSFSLQADLLRDLLPIIDNFERANKQFTEWKKSNTLPKQDQTIIEQWFTGFEMIYKSFLDFLHSHGVEPMNTAITFDPEIHEAIMHVNAPEHESGALVEILEQGYLFKKSVLRHAKVSVAQ